MGRSVQVDETIQQYAEGRVQSRVAAEVGILVGRCAPGKDLVLQALRTPERDGAEPISLTASGAAKKGGKGGRTGAAGSSSLQLDEELVVEHAALVERMLPGGLDVVGLYVLCPAPAFAAAASTLAGAAAVTARELAARLPSLLLLHVDGVSGALAAREAGGGGAPGLRPAEVRLAPLLDQMVHLQARLELSLQLPVTDGKQEVQSALQDAADAAAARVGGALALVGGQLASGERQLGELLGEGGPAPTPVHLLLQPPASLAFCSAGGGRAGGGLQRGRAESAAQGWVALAGCLDCRACLHRREPAARAAEALQADVRRSLAARLDALLEAAEEQRAAAAAEGEQRQGQQGGAAPPAPTHPLFAAAGDAGSPLAVTLPRRAFVSAAAAGGIPYCDYLFAGETAQALLGRLRLLLPTLPGLETAAVECLEQAAPAQQAAGAGSRQAQPSPGRRAGAATPCTLLAAGSAAAAVLALALGAYLSLGSA